VPVWSVAQSDQEPFAARPPHEQQACRVGSGRGGQLGWADSVCERAGGAQPGCSTHAPAARLPRRIEVSVGPGPVPSDIPKHAGDEEHWREVHSWSPASKGGRPSRTEEEKIQARIKKAYHTIHCQRLLVQGQGSQYFEVQQPSEDVPIDGDAAWARVGEQMARVWANVETRARNTIQTGEKDEVNPWLQRTQWLPYLDSLERPELLACVEEPVTEPDPRREQLAEPVEAAIWKAMDGLARFSQEPVISRIVVFVRLEAIQTEKHQTRFQPLQPYMDEKSIGQHVRPWQQMLMFFARTQREHTWKSPPY
jgi:hypothetical protein